MSFITRLPLDAALYDPAPGKEPEKRGPKRLKGARQPTLIQRLTEQSLCWQSLVITQWYNQKDKKVLVATGTALWYHSGMPPVAIR